MHFKLDQTPLGLAEGALLNIADAKGRTLRVLDGRVWITQEDCLDDVFLNAGESHLFEGSGTAVVTAEGHRESGATVLFDVPLSVQSRPAVTWRWLSLFGASGNLSAFA